MSVPSLFHLDSRNINLLWASLCIEELIRLGHHYFCISPGSRSTPLTIAAAQHPLAKTAVFYDERGAAFHALGYAKSTQKAAVLICTSGTALANYFPAVIEARQSHTPLIIMSADRPPELINTGANQAIDQLKIYGDYICWQSPLPCPTEDISPQVLLTNLNQGVFQAQNQQGPIHLNWAFREPLAPVLQKVSDGYLSSLTNWLKSETPHTKYIPPQNTELPSHILNGLAHDIHQAKQGLIVLGEMSTPSEQVRELCHRLNWPVCADVLSGHFLDPTLKNLLPASDFLLTHSSVEKTLQPDYILHLGGRFVSKRLLTHLSRHKDIPYTQVSEYSERQDPNHQVKQRLVISPKDFSSLLSPLLKQKNISEQTRQLLDLSVAGQKAIERQLTSLSEAAIVRDISYLMKKNETLFIGNSLAIRELDMYGKMNDLRSLQIEGNRGCSGIDGLVSSALGVTRGAQKPSTLILGDLSLIHDMNALSQLRELNYPVTLVVLNNKGGGIFSFLPIAQEKSVFTPFFETPHPYCFEGLAKMFNLIYERPTSLAAFRTVYQNRKKGHQLIEIDSQTQMNTELQSLCIQSLESEIASIRDKTSALAKPIDLK